MVWEIEARRAEQVVAVRARLDGMGLPADGEAYTRVVEALAAGDVLTANEYLHHIERGMPLPSMEVAEPNPFEAFFPGALGALEAWAMPNAAQVVRLVRGREGIPGVDLSEVAEAQAELAGDVLANWFRVRGRRGGVDKAMIQAVFGFIGFNVIGVAGQSADATGATRAWAEITTDPVRDRAQCPVALYGSRAAHRFTSDQAH